jgi:hypothetical protein
MSTQYAIEPDVRPIDRGLPRIGERRERAPRQPFPDLPEREGSQKRKPAPDAELEDETPDRERHIDIRV